MPAVPFTRAPDIEPRALRLAVAPTIPGTPIARVLSDRVRQIADAVSDAGGHVEETLPAISWDEQLELFGDLLETITSVSPDSEHSLATYLAALHRRDTFVGRWAEFFEHYDALLMPPAATVAFPHSEDGSRFEIDGEHIAYHEQGFVFAMPSLTGCPAFAMPAGLDSDGLPTGIQLVGPRWSEATLLSIGRGLEGAGITPGFQAPHKLSGENP